MFASMLSIYRHVIHWLGKISCPPWFVHKTNDVRKCRGQKERYTSVKKMFEKSKKLEMMQSVS
jgi:hypothetical protein